MSITRTIFSSLGVLYVTGKVLTELVALQTTDLLPSRSYCGYQHIDDYQRDGDNISIDEFPWMAQLLYNKDRKVQCSGSLINHRYVLTAAHCLTSDYAKLVGVRLGDFNMTSNVDCTVHQTFGEECNDPVEEFEIEQEIPHPHFHFSISHNDIGLIRLSRYVEYSDYIRPICLPLAERRKLDEGDELATSGWGLLGEGEQQTQVKKKILATLISTERCKEFYKDANKVINLNTLCALDGGKSTCRGDSGAPLMFAVNKQWEKVGLLSFGKCTLGVPSVYMKVSNYLDWIKANLRT